ncbi:hypothetical protein CDAR_275101 [Caerostris darwini]|uniref:Uncharacterized protein n=1 Tax=Caerostris darwini TaxID=1538125 RepID=A0AAV4UAZ7_9ARAC|nr:hypothetical protein CDAR_275101 [Caerostris darwini]
MAPLRVRLEVTALQKHNGTSIPFHYFGRLFTRADTARVINAAGLSEEGCWERGAVGHLRRWGTTKGGFNSARDEGSPYFCHNIPQPTFQSDTYQKLRKPPPRCNNSDPKIGEPIGAQPHACFIKGALCNRFPWLPVRVPREESALQKHNGTSITFHYSSRLSTRADILVCESPRRSGALIGWLL